MTALIAGLGFGILGYGLIGLVDLINPNARFWQKLDIVFPIILGLYIIVILAAYQARMVY